MPDEIFVENKEYTFIEATCLFAEALAAIRNKEAEQRYASSDLLTLLGCVNEHVPGEFEIYGIDSKHCRIVYKPEIEVVAGFKERWKGLLDEK